ncbi:MAG: DUF4287 domain-containing protein [Ktedonobacterales bacterium]|nr:DUF4287 domain-containing protein [Ktedonobacterales bacterium]
MPRISRPEDMRKAVLANLPAKTGHDLDGWLALIHARGPATHGAIREWLQREHGLGRGTASLLAGEALKPADYVPATPEERLAAQYAGAKAALWPIYERLVATMGALGDDVRLEPRETYVALIRQRQFALIQPSTKTRVDVGLVLPGTAPTSRLAAAGSFGSGRVTHRVALSTPEAVDAELVAWLRAAYERDA